MFTSIITYITAMFAAAEAAVGPSLDAALSFIDDILPNILLQIAATSISKTDLETKVDAEIDKVLQGFGAKITSPTKLAMIELLCTNVANKVIDATYPASGAAVPLKPTLSSGTIATDPLASLQATVGGKS